MNTTTDEATTVLTTDSGHSVFVRVANAANGAPAFVINGTECRMSPIDAHALACDLQDAADEAMGPIPSKPQTSATKEA